jgi:hypothetical protein
MDKASTLWSSYVSWATARRGGFIGTDMSFDQFVEELDGLEFLEGEAVKSLPEGESSEAVRGPGAGDENRSEPVDVGI